jgi:hypothetical protein
MEVLEMRSFVIFTIGLFFASGLYGQHNSSIDINSPFSQGPQIEHTTSRGETIFGNTSNQYGRLDELTRGNFFYCETAANILEHKFYLDPIESGDMWFMVYECSSNIGTYNLISSSHVTDVGPGAGWYSSGTVDVPMVEGNYYLIATRWDMPCYWYNQQDVSPFPFDCEFGQLVAACGWDWGFDSGNPPVSSVEVPAENGPFTDATVALHQSIVISFPQPTMLSNSSISADGNGVHLNWELSMIDDGAQFHILRSPVNEHNFVDLEIEPLEISSLKFSAHDTSTDPGQTYDYRVDFSLDGYSFTLFSLNDITTPILPLTLHKNSPNPFNPSTNIAYDLSKPSQVRLTIYDVAGRVVRNLVDEHIDAGSHDVQWDGINNDGEAVTSGVYFYLLEADDFRQSQRMMLVK